MNKRSTFCVIYGRRRVGKTELVKQFIKNELPNRSKLRGIKLQQKDVVTSNGVLNSGRNKIKKDNVMLLDLKDIEKILILNANI
ncbi:MAG: AAA family ATPase [Nanoarchaeota archaeon]|nr:AAA family ATPase [Nanoarchaeota archaeon]